MAAKLRLIAAAQELLLINDVGPAVAPVVVSGESPGQERPDGGPNTAGAVNDGGDCGQGLAAALQ